MQPPAYPQGPFVRLPRPVQWLALVVLSAVLIAAFELASLPAAFLIGPMLAAVACGVGGVAVRVAKPAFGASQAVIGILIAGAIEPSTLGALALDWPVIAAVVVATVAASSGLGYLISRWRVLPGTTAIWGFTPGAATAMVLMAEAFGADARLVAFMQYLRMIFVSVTAALVASLFVETQPPAAGGIDWLPPLDAAGFAATLATAAAGAIAGRLLRLPSPYFLGALILAVVLHLGFGVTFQLPPWLMAASFVLIGWSIGLNFDAAILRHAARALPQVVLSILALMAICGGFAALLVWLLDVDPLTAYLATSPGGMDTIAVIAAASPGVDLSFVVALQMARFLFVLLFGPAITRLVARRAGP